MRAAWTMLLVLLTLPLPLHLVPVADAAEAREVAKLPLGSLPDGSDNGIVGSSAATLGGAIYVLGGRLKSGTYSDAIYRFDPATLATEHVGSFPGLGTDSGGRQSGAALTLGSRIYYFGGAAIVQADLNGDGQTEAVPRALREIVQVDASGQATTLVDQLPAGAWGLSAAKAVVGGREVAFLFGGFSFDASNPTGIARLDTIVKFDPEAPPGTRAVRLQARLPYPVQDAAAVFLGNRIYLMGGLSDNEPTVNPCPTVRAYDPETNTTGERQLQVCTTNVIVAFDPVAEQPRDYSGRLPQRAQFLHAGVHAGKAYIPGGRLSDGAAMSDIVEFDPGAPAPLRTLVPTLPQGLFGAPVGADAQGNLYVFGGRTGGVSDLVGNVTRIVARPTAPEPPRSLASAALTGGGVRLTWEPPAYDGDARVTGYRVYRAGPFEEPALIAEPGAASLSHDDRSGRPGVEYVYRVTAVNGVGESVAAVATRATDVSAPGPVQDLVAYAGNGEVVLRWGPPLETGGANVTGYRVYRNGVLHRSLPAAAASLADTGLENGVTYRYAVRAANVKGEGDAGTTVSATPAAVPETPPAFAAAPEGDAVRLSWGLPSTGFGRFTVYRGELPARLSPIANVTDLGHLDATVTRGRTYHYAVTASNDIGESPPTEVVRVSLVSKPGAPRSVFAAPLEGAVRLTWQPPFDTGEADASALRYYVSRKDPGSDRFRILDTGEIRNTSWLDTRVVAGVEYAYTVTTTNPLASDPSEEARATPRQVANKAPSAFLEAEPAEAQPGDEVLLNASKSTDPDGRIERYEFDFGDGSEILNTTEPVARHAYAKDAYFTAKVRAIDNRGDVSEVAQRTLKIGSPDERPDSSTGGGNQPPTGVRPPATPPPGAGTGRVPGFEPLAALAALGALALARRKGT